MRSDIGRRAGFGGALTAVALLLAACAASAPVTATGAPITATGAPVQAEQPIVSGRSATAAAATVGPVQTEEPTVSGRSATAAAATVGTFTNPVIAQDFPDPSLLQVDGTFYLYGTETRGTNLQVRSSDDLVTWTAHPDPLPVLGSWTAPRRTWAPEVARVGEVFVLFYAAADRLSGRQCIGRAAAATPLGPFIDDAAAPFLCQVDRGGSIDPNPFTAPDGTRYLFWKSDGNCCGLPLGLWGQQLDGSASSLVGEPVELLTNNQPWQGPLVEGPEMVVHEGGYFLFYAANSYATGDYAQGVARCAGPLGPCADASEPVLRSNDVAVGPGHGYVFDVAGQWWIVYHAYPPDAVGQAVPGRQVWLDRVSWTPKGPVVDGPNGNPQANPEA